MVRMPELPDITESLRGLESRILHRPLERVQIVSPFFLGTANPPIESVVGMEVTGLRRLGKRVVLELSGEAFLVFHLMIAGRFRWSVKRGAKPRKCSRKSAMDQSKRRLRASGSPWSRRSISSRVGSGFSQRSS